MNDVQMIPVDLIDPHPMNPRRDVGDLTDLVASIEAQGIRQNLLVVPHPDEADRYRAVIGHRRLAAAQAARLPCVPAVVDDLTDTQQLELMLVENLQRTDLTPVEEAKGYQDMLDLGVKVREISRRTGRGEKVVTGRLKLLKLPWDAQEKIHTHQATLADAVTLERFAGDPKIQTKLIGVMGTADFGWQVKEAEREQKRAAERAKEIADLEAAGVVKFEGKKPKEVFAPLDGYRWYHGDAPYPEGSVYIEFTNWTRVYAPRSDTAEEVAAATDQSQAIAEAAAARKQLEQEAATARQLRGQFVEQLLARKVKPAELPLVLEAVAAATVGHYGGLGVSEWDMERLSIAQTIRDLSPAHQVLIVLDHHWSSYGDWTDLSAGVGTLAAWYGCLVGLGYQLSTVEADAIAAGERAHAEVVVGLDR